MNYRPQGTGCYQENDFTQASQHFQEGLCQIEHILEHLNSVKVLLHSNNAMACIKLLQF